MNPFDAFLTRCVRDSIEGYPQPEPEPDTGTATDDSAPHSHFCIRCGGVWSHEDEVCVGPRYQGFKTIVGDYDCPLCEGDR
jgi:hypothetical protein